MQEPEIVVRIVKDDFDGVALEEVAEFDRRSDGNRVDDCAPVASRDLEQIDAVEKTMEAGAFGIEGQLLHVRYVGEKAVYHVRLVEVERAVGVGRRHWRNLAP